MTFYTGDRFPNWKRNVFVAELREGGVPRTGQILLSILTAENQGALLRLEPADKGRSRHH